MLWARYRLTVEDRDALLEKQGGACAICREVKKLHVDHCHTTKKVRGLLCMDCNTGIGKLKDSKELVARALAYL